MKIYYDEGFDEKKYFNKKDLGKHEFIQINNNIINPDYYWIYGLDKHRNIFSQHNLKNSADNNVLQSFRLQLQIPIEIKEAVKEKKCKYIINHSLEGFWDIDFSFITDLLECDNDDFIWLSGDFNIESRYPDYDVRYVNFWERYTHFLTDRNVEIEQICDDNILMAQSKRIRDFYCTYYNRRIRDHRIALMSMMHHHGMLDDVIWSWGGRVDGRNLSEHGGISKRVKHSWTDKKYHDDIDVISKWENISYGPSSNEDLNINLVGTINNVHIKSSYYQLIVETWATDNSTTFLSEKSFKPFAFGQPFVIWGDAHSIDALRKHGYDVFDNWIRHKYDEKKFANNRLKFLFNEVEFLNSISPQSWAEMAYEMSNSLIHNKKNLKKSVNRYGLKL